jgi:glycosyltransferase involved in cell wall biosynthesis
MNSPLLTAAMIVRNEERHLPGCLASLAGVVDEIVVVDTGSSDRTVEIATSHGARVFHHPWADDFSTPRNVSLDHARGRWLLLIDADERLRPVDPARMATLLEDADEAAFLVKLYPFVGSTPSLEYRLWRSDLRIRFRDFVHARIVDAIESVAAADGRAIGVCGVSIDHLGYEGDQTLRHRRNIDLLRKQLAVEPDNLRNWRHLYRSLASLGRADEADQALERAMALTLGDPSPEAGLAWTDRVALRRERGDDITQLLAEGRARWPDNWLLVWVEGQVHFDGGRYEKAMACCRRLLEVDPDVPQPVVYPQRLFRSWPLDLVGAALFRLGRYAEAAEAYAAAERTDRGAAEYRVKRQVAEARAGAAVDVDAAAT